MQDILDELIAANLLQMPRPGHLLIQALHAGFLQHSPAEEAVGGPAPLLMTALAKGNRGSTAKVLLVLYGGNIARHPFFFPFLSDKPLGVSLTAC